MIDTWQDVYEKFVNELEHDNAPDYSNNPDWFDSYIHERMKESKNFSKFMDYNQNDLYRVWKKEESNSPDPLEWHDFACFTFLELLMEFKESEFIN